MGLQMTEFWRNGVLCKTDRGLVDLDNSQSGSHPDTQFNIIYIMRNRICQCRTHGQRFSKAGIVPSRFQAVTMTSLYKPSALDC